MVVLGGIGVVILVGWGFCCGICCGIFCGGGQVGLLGVVELGCGG